MPEHGQADIQIEIDRIAGLRRQTDPSCRVAILPSEAGSLRLRISIPGTVPIDTAPIDTSILANKSGNELWELLESITEGRIRRPL
jgi:hypothetical protein